MKDRIAYSPKTKRFTDNFDINFKKSPQKFAIYDQPQPPREIQFRANQVNVPVYKEFDNIKKISDEASSLRQTMNSKVSDRLFRRNTYQQQEEKPNKFNDFLRSTVSFKNNKALSEKYISDTTTSREVYFKGEEQSYKSNRNSNDLYKYGDSKSALNVAPNSNSIKQYEQLAQKIDRNKKIIEQLRNKSGKNQLNYLKNVNYNKSPSYLDLDKEKQLDEAGFKKKKKEEPQNYMTPKLDKGNYQARFNSSPIIQNKSSQKPKQQPIPINFTPSNSGIKKKPSIHVYLPKASMFEDFEIGKKLGEGKFGCVNLVKHKKTGGIFALKKIPKSLIKSHMMVDQLILQIRLQSCLKHPNILEMYGFFDDKTHLYIILEYMDGGTLYEKLKKGTKLCEKDAAYVIEQVTASIYYLHDLGIAHRDLKPENIVISNNVHKLCDFGWAAMCNNERRKTYCGTFDYVAPQILQGVEYDMTVDLWCLGVMTYQLMTGKAPFYHISRKQTMKKILNVQNQNIIYPENMSQTAKDFINKLIRKIPTERINAKEALMHPFLIKAQDQE